MRLFMCGILWVLPTIGLLAQSVDEERQGLGDVNTATATTRNIEAHQRALAMLGAGGNGLLLIPESTNDRVMAFDPLTGDLVDADFIPADATNLSTPIHAIRHPTNGNILVSDQIEDLVQEYDTAGNYIGVFAPVGGVNNAILDNIRGMGYGPNNSILVSVGGGTNADAIAQFDTDGTYLGNFVANAAGGLGSPFDVTARASDYLVGGINSDAIHRYDSSGSPLSNLTGINTFPEQVISIGSGNVLVANFSGTEEGIVEYTSAGAPVGIYDPASLGGYRGVYELPNGNILCTNGSGVHEIDRAGNLVETKIAGVSARFIEPFNVGPAIPPIPTLGPFGILILASLMVALGLWLQRRRRNQNA
ncbi:MAG: IPTL-CTERM sorting domain-containing protein [Acidobacteria bacterium]|nr:IPTL-CTERM sorting domain-containing protein [Acidobacteriota bacterium]